MTIHPTAIIDPTAELGQQVAVGPYSIIGPHCKLGDGTKIASNVVLQEYVTLGRNCQVSSGAVLGGQPQDLKFKGEVSYVVVGDDAVIRECATINRASGEGKATTMGNGCMLMAYAHLGHNCKLGNEVIIANATHLGGHVEVGDFAFISSTCILHQFVRIGRLAMVGGGSGLRQDVPPYVIVDGLPAKLFSINKVGLRRRGFDLNARNRIKRACTLLFFSEMNISQAVETIQADAELAGDPAVQDLLTFVRESRRGICKSIRKRRGDSSDEEVSEVAEGGATLAEIM